MFVQLLSRLTFNIILTGEPRLKLALDLCDVIPSVLCVPSSPPGEAASQGWDRHGTLSSVSAGFSLTPRSSHADVVLMTRINNAKRLYFHYSFAAADFTFCIIMSLGGRPSLHDNHFNGENCCDSSHSKHCFPFHVLTLFFGGGLQHQLRLQQIFTQQLLSHARLL